MILEHFLGKWGPESDQLPGGAPGHPKVPWGSPEHLPRSFLLHKCSPRNPLGAKIIYQTHIHRHRAAIMLIQDSEILQIPKIQIYNAKKQAPSTKPRSLLPCSHQTTTANLVCTASCNCRSTVCRKFLDTHSRGDILSQLEHPRANSVALSVP